MKKFSPFGDDLFGDGISADNLSVLKKKFIVAPFSVLDTKSGEFQERKSAWLSLGIKSEVGRGSNLLKMSDTMYAHSNGLLTKSEYTSEEWKEQISKKEIDTLGVSVFNPVICELAYEWFCPARGQILDPFAGGCVRGITASLLGFNYWGCDLRHEQIDSNIQQAKTICKKQPTWICGDSLHEVMDEAPQADFVFSCPPYGDLEKYSEDERDLSNMTHDKFLENYRTIIFNSCFKLKHNRFACFVVGDFRDKDGHLINFVGETIDAFKNAGLNYYSEAPILFSTGSAAMRATKIFNGGRKLTKIHQNLLVFVKGDWKKATNAIVNCPPARE